MKDTVLFLCGSNDFHAMDKFRLLVKQLGPGRVMLVTDTYDAESQPCLIEGGDWVSPLIIIGGFLAQRLGTFGHVWRNALKFLVLPFQARRLRKLIGRHQPAVVHAAPMYYMVLCWLAGVACVGTPQAAEILERPRRSSVYRWFAAKALKHASHVLVDSVQMRDECIAIFGVTPTVQKNGFDTELALIASRSDNCREAVLSVRGLAPNYRLENLIIARDCSRLQPRIDFVFPFSDVPCELRIRAAARASDRFLGKLSKAELYEKLSTCLLAVSLPQIDSSPRTVYEAVFCGAAVAVGKSAYLEELPECMRQRIFVVASVDEPWLDEAMAFAKRVTAHRYVPSTVALEMCNERLLTEKLLEKVYGFV